VVVRILADVADIENDGFLAEILPPVRGAGDFRPDLAGLVHDRLRAVAGVFDDLALLDIDQRRPVEAYAAAGREIFPAYGEAVGRLVARLNENGGGENAPGQAR
jgi:hypothetical protein